MTKGKEQKMNSSTQFTAQARIKYCNTKSNIVSNQQLYRYNSPSKTNFHYNLLRLPHYKQKKMNQITFLVGCTLLANVVISYSQDVIMHEYNFLNKENTILNFGPININLDADVTKSHIGDSNQTVTLSSLLPENNSSRLKKVEQENVYPVSTAVKIVSINNGQTECLCSGTMVSKRHILSTAHCFLEQWTNYLLSDSLVVYPAFNNGEVNQSLGQQTVTKAYYFPDWNLDGNDFILLEIDRKIGIETGWQGIAFNKSDQALKDKIFHKYSYPCFQWGQPDVFNGDTLYYSYGVYNLIDNFIGSEYVSNGWTGESGSSLFLTTPNNQNYIYGVFTWSKNMRHSRIDEREFFGMSKVLEGDNSTATINIEEESITVYPNPATDYLKVSTGLFNEPIVVQTINQLGQLIQEIEMDNCEAEFEIDTECWPAGIYYLVLTTSDNQVTKKFVKQRR